MLAKRLQYLVLFAVLWGIGLTSCGKKEEPSPETGTSEVAINESGVVSAPPPAKASPSDRAAALGFAKFLPRDTQGFLGLYDAAGLVAELRASKLGRFVEKIAASEGVNLDEINEDPQASMVLSLLKEEVFFAVGQGTPPQAANLMKLQEIGNFQQMKMMVQLAAAAVTGGDTDDFDDDALAMGAFAGMLKDPNGVLSILEQSKMPPVLLGFKVSDEEARLQLSGIAAGGLAEFVAMAGPEGENVAEAVEIPQGESSLNGVRLVGEKLVAKMKEENVGDELGEIVDQASVDRLFKALTKNNLVVASGVVDNYVLFFLGSEVSDFKLATSPEEALVSSAEFSFVDGFLGKKLIAVSNITKPLLDAVGRGSGLGNMAAGIKAGLAETDAFGDTSDLAVLLDLVASQEKVLLDMYQYVPGGMVAYRDQGYKLETFGGSTRPDLDLEKEHQFGSLAQWDGALLYAGAVGNEDFTEKSLEYLDTVGETVYLAAKKISKLAVDDGDFRDFQQGFGMFESVFRDDLLQLWKALREDVTTGLGGESSVLIDLKGGLPTAPGLAPVLVEQGKMPRVAVIAPIKDRAKMGEAWSKIDGSLSNILKKVGEMSGQPIPMQQPMSSEKDSLITWFLPIPFQTEDFTLSVSLDDDNFYATTSKNFSKQLAMALKESGSSKQKGAYLRFDFRQLLAYVKETLALVEDNAEAVFAGDERTADEFRENLPQIQAALEAMSELKDLQMKTRLEGGRVRNSLHLNME